MNGSAPFTVKGGRKKTSTAQICPLTAPGRAILAELRGAKKGHVPTNESVRVPAGRRQAAFEADDLDGHDPSLQERQDQ